MTQVNHRQLFTIAIPMILSNITAPLLGLVDTAVIGHLPHSYYLGGSTVGAMIITFVIWLCGFLRMSTTGLSAQAYGAQDSPHGFLILGRGLLVAGVIGLLLLLFQTPYIESGLFFAGGSEQVQFYAREYAQVRVWGLPAALANIVIAGWLLGQHRAKAVLLIVIVTNLVNLVLDIYLVMGLSLGVAGVALATVIAEYTGLVLGLVLIVKVFGQQLKSLMSQVLTVALLFDKAALISYFNLNKDILIRTLCLELCFVFMTFQGARLGDDIVAANAILMNFLLLISFGLDGIANAAEVLVGKAKGQKEARQINLAVSISMQWTVLFAAVYSLFFWLAAGQVIQLITTIETVITTANQYVIWIVLLPLLSCWCFLFDGIYVGLTNARTMRNSMLVSTFLVFFPVWLVCAAWGNHGLWFAFSLFMVSRGVTLMWHYYFHQQKQLID